MVYRALRSLLGSEFVRVLVFRLRYFYFVTIRKRLRTITAKDAFAAYELNGQRILLPRAAVARDLVPTELARRGAHVDVVETYRTVQPPDAAARRLTGFWR